MVRWHINNNITISNSVKKLKRFEEDQRIGIFDQLSKEASRKQKISSITTLFGWDKRNEILTSDFHCGYY